MNLKVDDYIRIIKDSPIFGNKLKPGNLGQVVNIDGKNITITLENICSVFVLFTN